MLRLSLSIFLILTQFNLFAQSTSEIMGIIKDSNNAPIPGATIVLTGTNFGVLSNSDGTYKLKNIPAGNYEISVSYIGYQTITNNIKLLSARTQEFNFTLNESTTNLENVVVTGKSESQLKLEQPIQVESIRLKLVQSKIRDFSDALVTLPGVRVQSSGSLGDNANISLNGLSGQAVRTYVDGLPFEFLYPSLSITNVPMVNIRRLDVYKGVVPVDIGTDAMAGAINIVSDYRVQNYAEGFFSFGSFNTHQAGLNAAIKLNDNVAIQVNGAYNYSDNNYKIDAQIVEDNGRITEKEVERFHDAYELAYANASVVFSDTKLFDYAKFNVSYSDYFKEVNNNVTISVIPWGEYEYSGDIAVSSFLFEKEIVKGWELSNNLAYSYATLNTVDTTSRVYSWDGSWELRTDGRRGEFNPGQPILQNRNNNNLINRTNLKFALSDYDSFVFSNVYAYQDISGRDEMRSIEDDPLQFPQDLTKNVSGLLFTHKKNKLTVNLAGKYYIYDLLGRDSGNFEVNKKDSQFGGYAALKYDIKPNLFVRTSFERGLRIPNSGEFFGNGVNISPNTSLVPETSNNLNLELGLRSKEGAVMPWMIQANGFFRDQENLIQLSGSEVLPKYLNQRGVRTIGLETEIRIELTNELTITNNITALRQTITALNNGNANSDQIGAPNPNIPKFFSFSEFSYVKNNAFGSSNSIRAYIQYYFVDTFNHIPVGNIFNPDNWVPAQHRVNLGVQYLMLEEKLTLSANVFNALDGDLFDNFNVPRPGRNFNVGLRYRIDNF